MMRLNSVLCVYMLLRQANAFRPFDCVGRSAPIRDPTRYAPVRNWGILFALDDADGSFEGDVDSFVDGDAEVVAPPAPKKKAPKRKPKASVAAAAAAPTSTTTNIVNDASTVTDTLMTAAAIAMEIAPAPAPAPELPAQPATLPSKIYYRAKEDNEIYAISSISIDSTVRTLKDLKKLLVDANEWPESSRVIFYSGDERLAFTTTLMDCLLDNSLNKPLSVTVLTTATVNESPAATPQIEEITAPEEVYSSISLYQGQSTSSVAPDISDTTATVNDMNNMALVKDMITPTPQVPIIPGPKTGRGAVVDIYSNMPAQSSDWANRLPVETPQLRQMQDTSYPPPPPRPPMEETGRFWMNKISLDLGVVLVAKVMKALERSQFLVLAAPGGYGKTSLLQLLERVYEKQGKCVVRFRILQDTDVYHQFQTSSGIDLKNAYIHDLRPNYQKVILIDDAHKVYDTPGFWEVLLKKFPTWCFAWDYKIIFAVTLPVAQGSPIIELLGDPTIPHLGPKDFVPDQ